MPSEFPIYIDSSAPHWYALVVKHQHERRTEKVLQSKGWETLVPLYRTRRQWSDRMRDVDLPLFAGYVFCRFPVGERVQVEDTPGVARIVGFGGLATPLPDQDIEEIRTVCRSKVALSPWPFLKAGDRVRIERGPLRGIQGTLLRNGDNLRLVIGVELLQRSVAAEVDPSMVTPMRSAAAGQ